MFRVLGHFQAYLMLLMQIIQFIMISVESHSKQVKLLNDYIQALQKQVSSARKQNEEYQKHSSRSSQDIRMMNEDINKLRNQNNQLKNNIARQDDAVRRCLSLEKQLIASREELQRLTLQHNRLVTSLIQSQNAAQSFQHKYKEVEEELKRKTQHFVGECSRDRQQIEQLKKTIIQKDKQKDQITQGLAQEKKVNASKASMLQSNNQILKSKTDIISRLSKQLQDLKGRYNKDMISSSQTRNSLGEQIKQLVTSSNQAKLQLMTVKKQLVQVRQKLEGKTRQCQQQASLHQNDKAILQITIHRLQQNKKANEYKIATLEEESKKLEAFNRACKGDITENGKALAQALKKIQSISNQLFIANQNLAQQNSVNIQAHKQIESLKYSLSEANRAALIRDEETRIRQEYIKTLNKQLQASCHQIEQLQEAKSSLLTNVQQLTNKSDAFRKQLDQLHNQIEIRDSIIEQKNNSIRGKTNQCTSLQVQLKKQKESIRKATAELQEKNQNLFKSNKIRSQLQSQLKALEEQIGKIRQQAKHLSKQKTSLQVRIEELTAQQQQMLKQRVGDKDLLAREITSRDTKLKDITNKYQQLSALYTQSNNQNSQMLERQKAKYLKEINEVKNDNENAISKLNKQIQQRNSLLQKTIQEHQRQIKSLKEQWTTKQKQLNSSIAFLSSQRDSLSKELKQLGSNLSSQSQANLSKQMETQSLRKTVQRLQLYSKQQKNAVEQLQQLLSHKSQQIESLQSSNTLLRKQLISALSNEQTSRKELIETKSKVNVLKASNTKHTLQFNPPMEKFNTRSLFVQSKKKTSFMDRSNHQPNLLLKKRLTVQRIRTQAMNQSLVQDLYESNIGDLNNEKQESLD